MTSTSRPIPSLPLPLPIAKALVPFVATDEDRGAITHVMITRHEGLARAVAANGHAMILIDFVPPESLALPAYVPLAVLKAYIKGKGRAPLEAVEDPGFPDVDALLRMTEEPRPPATETVDLSPLRFVEIQRAIAALFCMSDILPGNPPHLCWTHTGPVDPVRIDCILQTCQERIGLREDSARSITWILMPLRRG